MSQQKIRSNTLVFSIALNGYQWLYKDFLHSHERYANRYGYDYQAVTKPMFTSLGVECCWLKLTLIQNALIRGYERVLFVDADAQISDRAPQILDEQFNQGHVLMARSYSGRFNSGVMLVKNHALVIDWLAQVLANKNKKVAAENSVGWGENGHIIECSKGSNIVGELDPRWNNTQFKDLADYIRHFNYGPLRSGRTINALHYLFSKGTQFLTLISSNTRQNEDKGLQSLTQSVLNHYPIFIL